ncbi:MAG: cold shock domain-containing protein [Nanoarchaeota archaeon]|nr:cold shock domain-containing protein [Nanoarchaeota archaeon]
MNGTVKFYNRVKQFGFVTGDDGEDYFVHVSAVKEGVNLDEGVRVSFQGMDGDRGKKAENVTLEESSSEESAEEEPEAEESAEEEPEAEESAEEEPEEE